MEKLYGKNDKNSSDNYTYINKEGVVGIVSKPIINKTFLKGISPIEIVHKAESVLKAFILTNKEKMIKTVIDGDTFTVITTNFPEMKDACFIPNDSKINNPMPFIGQLDSEYYLIASPLSFNFEIATDLMREKI